VRVADDLRDAKIYVVIEGDEAEIKAAFKALKHASPYIRQQAGLNLNLRHTPQLYFMRDTVEERASKLQSVLDELALDKESQESHANDEQPK
jgi:ribosome-binding factor A